MDTLIPSGTLIFFQSVLLLVVVAINGVTDLVNNKLYNTVNFPAIVLGLIVNCLWGWQAFTLALAGLVIGFGLFFVVYLFAGIGGGDVKFMAAIGAIGIPRFHESVGGYPFILWVCFYSALFGGLIAFIAMMAEGRLMKSLRNVARTVFTFLVPLFETVPLKPEDSISVPFGFGIAVGAAWTWWLYASGFIR